jgi:hypothetical protein
VSTDVGVTDPNAQFIGIRNLQVNGNRLNQTAGHGIKLSLDPSFPSSKPAADDYYDSHQFVENVRIIECKEDGLNSSGRSENRFNNVITFNTDGYGFVNGSDTWLNFCTASHAGLAGFKPTTGSSNIHIATSKAFYCGRITPASGTGLHMANNFACHITGFIAQDNKANGILLDSGCQGNILTGIVLDSNSTRGIANNPALDLWDSQDNLIFGRVVERKADGTNSYQRNAVRVRSNSQRNRIYLSFHAENAATLGQAVADVLDDYTNIIEINGSRCKMFLPATFAASYTPSPYATDAQEIVLTGNITINAPTETNIPPGTTMTLVLTQDATGGRTMTFNAVYKTNWTPVTTASKTNIIEFMYTGSSWLQTSSTVNL